jgi:peptidoglycan/xylan/chitin deacetylase (PgdA/CDA1 family)
MPAAGAARDAAIPRTSRRQVFASLLYRSGLIGALAALRSLLKDDLRILAYHRVLPIDDEAAFDFDLELVSASPAQFESQMRLLRRRCNPVTFHDLIAAFESGKPLPRRPVVVTFDDGYDDNYRHAFPILRELGMPATFFVSTGHIDSGRPYAYDWFAHMICRTRAERLTIAALDVDCDLPVSTAQRRNLASELLDRMKSLDASTQEAIITDLETGWSMPRERGHADCRPMSWDQLREMQAAGMEIGSHGVWHNMLAKLSPAAMHAEVVGSKQALDRELGRPAEVISYPVGGLDAYNDAVVDAARAAGYKIGCSYISGTSPIPREPAYALRRLPVEREMDAAWFAALTGIPEAFNYPSRHRTG